MAGHFWDGRHFRKPVNEADLLVIFMAYDHRNPVREAMAVRPEDYARSSAGWWARGDPVALPICRRPDLPFGFTRESLRAELLRFQRDKRIDDTMEALSKAGLSLDSCAGREELTRLMAECGLRTSTVQAVSR